MPSTWGSGDGGMLNERPCTEEPCFDQARTSVKSSKNGSYGSTVLGSRVHLHGSMKGMFSERKKEKRHKNNSGLQREVVSPQRFY